MRYEDENIWLSQKMIATLYDVTVPAINPHLKRIFADRELAPDAVMEQLLTTAADRKTHNVEHYSLQAIIAVGFKIENERAVQCSGPPLRERLRPRRGRDQAPR